MGSPELPRIQPCGGAWGPKGGSEITYISFTGGKDPGDKMRFRHQTPIRICELIQSSAMCRRECWEGGGLSAVDITPRTELLASRRPSSTLHTGGKRLHQLLAALLAVTCQTFVQVCLDGLTGGGHGGLGGGSSALRVRHV